MNRPMLLPSSQACAGTMDTISDEVVGTLIQAGTCLLNSTSAGGGSWLTQYHRAI
ncbi:hypothetical protein PROFUN_03581 [Planoprotostelium fungivorum]|uniref:Uncharacterized protein n=1 Tax=Planoprotostelium fungivorum TaxID=1890364 RepID=A0A2P6MSI1_9EUKA|nr:hypothetical protein PROFUN_03581 [Planoprotostelium fungivorum]